MLNLNIFILTCFYIISIIKQIRKNIILEVVIPERKYSKFLLQQQFILGKEKKSYKIFLNYFFSNLFYSKNAFIQ